MKGPKKLALKPGSRQSFQERRQAHRAKPWPEEMDSAWTSRRSAAWRRPPHFRAPRARAMMKPRTSRNMATESSTVMTTMPPVRAIPSSMDSTFLPVRRERREALVGRRSPYPDPRLSGSPGCPSSIYSSSQSTDPHIRHVNIYETSMLVTEDTDIGWT